MLCDSRPTKSFQCPYLLYRLHIFGTAGERVINFVSFNPINLLSPVIFSRHDFHFHHILYSTSRTRSFPIMH